MMFCGIFITTLVAMGGFAVDIGNWYLHALRMQRAADAAALAGSVYLPGDYTTAKSTAQSILVRNGAVVSSASITQVDGHPSELKVTLNETVSNYFSSLVGYKSTFITRLAIGEYRPYVPMGSPSNLLGSEPSNSTTWEKTQDVGLQNHYWLNIAAAGTAKSNGDRYSGGLCDSSTDGCDPSQVAPAGNADYSSSGQTYVVRVNPGTTGTLKVQAYDPVFAYVGDVCDQNLAGADTYSPGTTHLYAAGVSAPGCTGDQMTDTTKLPQDTKFELFTPAISAGGSKAISVTNCTAQTYPGYKGAIANKVNPASGQYDPIFTNAFRKWTTVCTITLGTQFPPGDYVLHVSNGNSTSYNGLNRFALRAAIVNSDGSLNATQTQNLSLFSQGRLVIYAKEEASDVTFFIARIHSGAAGHVMTVTLFDIGDAAQPVNLSFLPPSDAKSGGSTLTNFPDCQYTAPKSNTYQNMGSGCSITGMTSASYNGRVVNLKVTLPNDYTCDDNSADGCWTRLKLHYGAGSVTDTTSWEVALNGNPVHLVADN